MVWHINKSGDRQQTHPQKGKQNFQQISKQANKTKKEKWRKPPHKKNLPTNNPPHPQNKHPLSTQQQQSP